MYVPTHHSHTQSLDRTQTRNCLSLTSKRHFWGSVHHRGGCAPRVPTNCRGSTPGRVVCQSLPHESAHVCIIHHQRGTALRHSSGAIAPSAVGSLTHASC